MQIVKKTLIIMAMMLMANFAVNAASTKENIEPVSNKTQELTKIEEDGKNNATPFGWWCYAREVARIVQPTMDGEVRTTIIYEVRCYYYEVPFNFGL